MSHDRALRVLITRLSHVGDCVLTLPIACALRDHFQHVHITWVVERPSDQLLRHHQAVDELLVLRPGWLKRPREVWQLRRRLQTIGCDVAIDPQSLTKSALVAWLSGVPRRIGLDAPVGRELAPWLHNELLSPLAPHVVDRSLGMLHAVGIAQSQPRFGLAIQEDAAKKIATFLSDSHLGCGFAVINPGAGWVSRRWPPRHFGAVARHLGQQHQLPSVVAWAGTAEREWAAEIQARAGGHAILAPPTDLNELAALLHSAQFYIGSDTGPMHLAAAMGTACVGLYGPTRPTHSGAYGGGHIAVQSYYQQQDRRISDAAMQDIQVKSVVAACERMIASLPGRGEEAHAA